jgi:mannose-6-phosphate isomerase-like protein (cupin superfamily)
MRHPEPDGLPDRRPIELGEVWENPVTGERGTILERPWENDAGRATSEMTALVGARVVGEHRHPALVERFTVLEGELTMKRDEQTSILHQGETAVIGLTYAQLVECQQRRRAGTGGDHTGRAVPATSQTFSGLAQSGTQTARAYLHLPNSP